MDENLLNEFPKFGGIFQNSPLLSHSYPESKEFLRLFIEVLWHEHGRAKLIQ